MVKLITFCVSSLDPILNIHIENGAKTIDKLVPMNGKDSLELGFDCLKDSTGSDFSIVSLTPAFGMSQWNIQISVDGKIGACFKAVVPNTEIRKMVMEAAVEVYNFWYPS